jgi:hypothetical protein
MLSRIIKLIVVIAILALVIVIFPIVYDWLKIAINWILSFGKYGVIIIASCIICTILDFND